MKCVDCAFREQAIESPIGIIFVCAIKGLQPKPDCPYYKKAQPDPTVETNIHKLRESDGGLLK